MQINNDNTYEIKLKISTADIKNNRLSTETTSKSTLDFQDFYLNTNLKKINVDRYTEHGSSEIHSFGFAEFEQRLNILELLDHPSILRGLKNIYEIIFQLGSERNYEKRHYAAVAVSILSKKHPFIDLKESIILRWAISSEHNLHVSAAIALSNIIKHKEHEVIMLLNHWINQDNPKLINSALITYSRISKKHPNEALKAIENILKARKIDHYLSVFYMFKSVYRDSPLLAINRLHEWIFPIADSDLCWVSCELLFAWIKLDDAIKDGNTRMKVVDMVFNLWDNPKIPMYKQMQEKTDALIEIWASESIEKINNKSTSEIKNYKLFFNELNKRYDGKRNRLLFYLQRWDSEKQKIKKNNRRQEQDPAMGIVNSFNFSDLVI